MERLLERIELAKRTLMRLEEVLSLAKPQSIERDAAIKRFEFAFEAVWKAAKDYLWHVEGIDSSTPKSVIRSCREAGVLTADEAVLALKMANDRNLTVRTYNESMSLEIYQRLKAYRPLFSKWINTMIINTDIKGGTKHD